uniref:Uncharacterized protein n=1 Tax=Myotis myotis TaxID=51298 RepID=A0A7J7Z5J2_MYOMY|nr:hypothetical protein mMyoMyo1_010771 [Myotis myotis]
MVVETEAWRSQGHSSRVTQAARDGGGATPRLPDGRAPAVPCPGLPHPSAWGSSAWCPHYSGRPRDLSPETPRFCCKLGAYSALALPQLDSPSPCSHRPLPGWASPAYHSAVCALLGAQHLFCGLPKD